MSKRSFDQIDGSKSNQSLKIKRTEREERSSIQEITSWLCRDVWSKVVEFCETKEWLQLSYTCKGINQFKFNRSLMFNKKKTLRGLLRKRDIDRWFQLSRGTLFNIDLNSNRDVTDEHFQFLEGIHTLDMRFCDQITDKAVAHLNGIRVLDMKCCKKITDEAFVYLKGIHKLDMYGCLHITDKALAYLEEVHILNMGCCVQITDKAFVHLEGIHTLDMSYCTQITDNAFVHLTSVRYLVLNYCRQESLQTEKLLGYLKNVRYLFWYGTTILDDFKDKLQRFVESNSIELYLS